MGDTSTSGSGTGGIGSGGLDSSGGAALAVPKRNAPDGKRRKTSVNDKSGKRGDSPSDRVDQRDRRSFFELYKPGQGYWTRMGTAVGSGILILAGGSFLFKQLEIYRDDARAWTLWLQAGIPLLAMALMGLLTYWLVGSRRGSCDFLIATEGEMKKVSWSTRKEIVGSTKVVIAFTLLMAAILFVVDIIFMSFFAWIGVLRSAPDVFTMLFGGGD